MLMAVLRQLGNCEISLGRPYLAEPFYRKAVAVAEAQKDRSNRDLILMLDYLGICLLDQKKYPATEVVFKRLLPLEQAADGKEGNGVKRRYRFFTDLYQKWGKKEEAKRCYALSDHRIPLSDSN